MQSFRVTPALPVSAMKTFQVVSPISTHFRPATCAETECDAYVHGWMTLADESSDRGRRVAHYIRKESGRRFGEEQVPGLEFLARWPDMAAGFPQPPALLTVFTFEAGQRCFSADEHRVRIRPERFVERGGDWRGNPRREVREHTAASWTDAFAEHQDRLKTAIQRG